MTASLSQRRSHYRQGAADINRTIDAAVAEIAAEKQARVDAGKAAIEAEKANRRTYTREDLLDARIVSTRYIDAAVIVKINQATLTVDYVNYNQVVRTRVPFRNVTGVLK